MRIETPPSAMRAPDTLTEINYPRKELVHGLIETRRVYVLSAQIGFGKSNIARHMAYSVASGQPFFGVRTHTSRVAFVNGEIESDSLQELDHRVPEGTELVVFDFPSTVINHGSAGSLSELAERRKLAIFATSRRPGPALLDDPNIEHWRADYIDAAGGSYAHGRIEIEERRAIPIVRGADGDWTLDVYRVTKAFGNLDFHRYPQFPPTAQGLPRGFRPESGQESELERYLRM
jgi:AAA domain-containing protein